MLIILELIKTRTSRSEQHYITRAGTLERLQHGGFEGAGANQFHCAGEFLSDAIRRRANEENLTHPVLQQRPQRRVGRTFVLASQDEMNPALESPQ